jgi:hypothetical protein
MKKRPLFIVITAFIFIITDFISIAYHAYEYFEPNSIKFELVWTLIIRVLAIVCGLLLLGRVNWAGWLAIVWLAYHVDLSLFHSASETIIHVVLLAIVSFLLIYAEVIGLFQKCRQLYRQEIK